VNFFFSTPLPATENDLIQGRLLRLAAGFLVCLAALLTLSPAARLHSWEVDFRWSHWIGVGVWFVMFGLLHRASIAFLPERDPYLIPIASMLSGWGLLTIGRLNPGFGNRQALWLFVSLVVIIAGLRVPGALRLLRRYKYIWLTAGLILLGLTFLFGTYPDGSVDGPHLWLGCCGIYFQPSEPLKLLLIVYMAAYLADYSNLRYSLVQLIVPTLVLVGAASLLLVVQRDLGTASLFIALYTILLFIGSGRKRVLIFSFLTMAVAAVAGYFVFDVVRLRIDAWLNPWADPSGRSYQIVQSLIAVASGGILGSGIGMGSPSVVPVAHSDFIFSALSEETGLVGSLGLIAVLAFLAMRGIRLALRAPDLYQRFLAVGCTAYLVGQSILIIGGNLRLFPLTGVTLPFVSYGGSSLLTAFLTLLLLLLISHHPDQEPAWLHNPRLYQFVGLVLLAGLAAAALLNGWWGIYRSPVLANRTDNPRRTINDRYVRRGTLLDREAMAISATRGKAGDFSRWLEYPAMSPVIGYNHPLYGQSGLEASLDGYLRGAEGNPLPLVAWTGLLYHQTPPGLDVRVSLDVHLQVLASDLLAGRAGTIVLLNAGSGELLAMASTPGFDANRLEEDWANLIQNSQAPLINRATQGKYPPGAALGPLLLAYQLTVGEMPDAPESASITLAGKRLPCTRPVAGQDWGTAVSSGCPGAAATLAERIGPQGLRDAIRSLGLLDPPVVSLPMAEPDPPAGSSVIEDLFGEASLQTTPLQIGLASAALSAGGAIPTPHLVLAIHTPDQGWGFSSGRTVCPGFFTGGRSIGSSPFGKGGRSFLEQRQPFPTGR